MLFGIAEIERIDDHADIGGILARLPSMRDFDELERGIVHDRLEFLVSLPVAVSLFENHGALYQQALENQLDIEFFHLRVSDAERDVFEIAEYREILVFIAR